MPIVNAGESAWWAVGAIVALCGLGILYGKGIQDLWQRRTTGDVISVPRAMLFAAGLAAVAAAITGPVHEMAERSFTGHMVQHMLLITVAAPLLGAGGAALPVMLALPRPIRRGFNKIRACPAIRWIRKPVNKTLGGGLLFTAVFWLWHLPAVYMLAVRHPAIHAFEHLLFVVVAWMLWAVVLTPGKHRLTGPLGFLLLFAVGMTGAALGAVLTFAPVPLYPPEAFASGGADPLSDQQLAGLIMWIPMDVVVLALALGIFGQWLTSLDQRFPADRDLVRPATVSEVAS